MKKVVVTGANGQLGRCLHDLEDEAKFLDIEFLFLDRGLLDITNTEIVESYFFSNKIDAVVNCAAYTAVDKAEEDIEKAFQVNADAVGLLARECKESGADFIHISTDYVFNGENDVAYAESHETQPQNVYGKSKLQGELNALENNPNSIIIRTAWVYSQYGKNFLKTMLWLFQNKEEVSVVNDQFGTPTNANDIAQAILKVLAKKDKTPGIYHFTNSGETSWFGFAEAIKEITHSNIKINGIPTSEYPTPASRPRFSVLNTQKIQDTFGVKVPHWKASLKKLFDEKQLSV